MPIYFLKNSYFRERGREGGREGEKHQCAVASHAPPTGGLACNPGVFHADGALTGYGTSCPSVRRLALNPLSHPSQGPVYIFL